MATPTEDAAYELLRGRLRSKALISYPPPPSFFAQYFLKPDVYGWHKPTVSPKGFFNARPDPYVWFDPLEGHSETLPAPRDDRWDGVTSAFKTLYVERRR